MHQTSIFGSRVQGGREVLFSWARFVVGSPREKATIAIATGLQNRWDVKDSMMTSAGISNLFSLLETLSRLY